MLPAENSAQTRHQDTDRRCNDIAADITNCARGSIVDEHPAELTTSPASLAQPLMCFQPYHSLTLLLGA